jgi:ABC-2 type transport system permease protein
MTQQQRSTPNPGVTLSPCHPVTLSSSLAVTASSLATLFWLTLRQQARGRRLLILSLLFLLPAGLAVLLHAVDSGATAGELETALIFALIPHALAPLSALLYATGTIQDEVEEQTLTYLLVRPLPRWALYIVKLSASVLTTSLLTAAGTAVAYTAAYWGSEELWSNVPARITNASLFLALAQVAYCAVFGIISLLTRRSLIAGIVYIVVIEGLLANWEFIVRKLTIVYYFRVLSLRWINPPETQDWAITLSEAPSTAACIATLLGVGLLLTALGGWLFSQREYAVKTPEAAS